MSANPSSHPPEDLVLRMEERIGELERRLKAIESEAIPWHVIAAAVAAVMPDARIVSISPEPSQRLWHASGLMRNIYSHQIR